MVSSDSLVEHGVKDDPSARRRPDSQHRNSVWESSSVPVGGCSEGTAAAGEGAVEAGAGDLLGEVLGPDEAFRETVPEKDVAVTTAGEEMVRLGVGSEGPELVGVTLDQWAELCREIALGDHKQTGQIVRN